MLLRISHLKSEILVELLRKYAIQETRFKLCVACEILQSSLSASTCWATFTAILRQKHNHNIREITLFLEKEILVVIVLFN